MRDIDDQSARPALSPAAGSELVRVGGLKDLPGALMQLARLIADRGHLEPITVRRIGAEHARTVLMLADVLARRDTVPGATAPPLLGVPSELRAHAGTLTTLRATVRGLRSATAEDPRPMQQLREIRRRLRREDRRMRGRLTDQDLHAVMASLRPALWVGPALHSAVTTHLRAGTWHSETGHNAGKPATVPSTAAVADAALATGESAMRLMVSLPPRPPPPGSPPRSQEVTARLLRRGYGSASHRSSATVIREASGDSIVW